MLERIMCRKGKEEGNEGNKERRGNGKKKINWRN
jgi:hypothetical protein